MVLFLSFGFFFMGLGIGVSVHLHNKDDRERHYEFMKRAIIQESYQAHRGLRTAAWRHSRGDDCTSDLVAAMVAFMYIERMRVEDKVSLRNPLDQFVAVWLVREYTTYHKATDFPLFHEFESAIPQLVKGEWCRTSNGYSFEPIFKLPVDDQDGDEETVHIH